MSELQRINQSILLKFWDRARTWKSQRQRCVIAQEYLEFNVADLKGNGASEGSVTALEGWRVAVGVGDAGICGVGAGRASGLILQMLPVRRDFSA